MAVKLGATAINALYLGATAINKAYLGATLIFGAAGGAFDPVDASVASLRELGQQLATLSDSSGVQDGQSLTVNSESVGSYHYRVIDGNHTISAFASNDYFSTVEDSDWEVLVVKGDLTVSDDVIPSLRKLGLAIYVTGDLVINNSVSMTARGANHSAATGSNISAIAVRIADGTYSGVTDPEIPAAGGDGGAGMTLPASGASGNGGSNGTGGGTGGGGGGSVHFSATSSGAGAAGTSFSGGSGGGGQRSTAGTTSTAGASDGGPGGKGGSGNVTSAGGGGAGNPGGDDYVSGGPTGNSADDGTGGILLIVCLGELSGGGTISADGSDSYTAAFAGGGGSGGGTVTVLYGSDASSITPTANGGAGNGGGWLGGHGGLGTARKLAIA